MKIFTGHDDQSLSTQPYKQIIKSRGGVSKWFKYPISFFKCPSPLLPNTWWLFRRQKKKLDCSINGHSSSCKGFPHTDSKIDNKNLYNCKQASKYVDFTLELSGCFVVVAVCLFACLFSLPQYILFSSPCGKFGSSNLSKCLSSHKSIATPSYLARWMLVKFYCSPVVVYNVNSYYID